ncbi:MAG: twin-arginine translocase TatA/TatE family subunit [Deltaproteobacteria bacterium]|nr:twin-arginine translocase TatA/TatE family subunit [Deltaproteobacteria bacterium]
MPMSGLGVQELMMILIIALIIFGPAKLPQIGSGLGKAIRDFKRGIEDSTKQVKTADKDD